MQLIEAVKIRFKKLMKDKNFKQFDFYSNGGMPKSTVSQFLNGKKKKVTIYTIYEMVAAMGVSLKEFFDDPIFDEVTD